MAAAARALGCEMRVPKMTTVRRSEPVEVPARISVAKPSPVTESENTKIVLQPRLCTLRSYGSDRIGVMKTKTDVGDGGDEVSPFFATLSEYIESSKRSQDFEIISGRLAMVSETLFFFINYFWIFNFI